MDVIRMMFWGDIFPAERVKADSPQFYDAKNEATAISEKIHRELPQEYVEWFEAYCQANSEMAAEMYLAFFRYGIRIGFHLKRELTDEA